MNDSQNPEDERAGAEDSAPEHSGGDSPEASGEAEGLAEPSAEELLTEDEDWDGPDEEPSVEVDPDAAEQEPTDDAVEMDKTAELSPDDLDSDMDLDDLREEARKAKKEAQGEGEVQESGSDSSSGLPSPDDLADSGPDEATAGSTEADGSEEAATADADTADGGATDDAESGTGEGEKQPVELANEVSDIPEAAESELGAPPSLPEQPDDVKGSRETPDQQLEFRSGDRVGGRFIVERYLGSSGGGISYLCREEDSGDPVVIKVLTMPAPSGDHLEWIREQIRTASRIRAENLTDILGMGTTEDGKVYVAMDYIEGQSLSRALATQREKGREIGLAEMYHVVEHICDGLEVIHEHLAHGLLTPFNIYIGEAGEVQIQNLGFGQISARYLHSEGKGPFRDSIYVAPEVTADPDNLSPRSDLYSAGMIVAEMLSGGGLPRQKGEAREVAARIAQTYSDGIHRLVGTSLSKDPSKRTGSTAEFRMALENAVKEAGVDPADGLPEEGLPIRPAVEVREGEDELFDIPGPDESQEVVTEEAEERYLVRKEGLDYGPFTKDEVLDQLYDDEIDEHTSVLDRATQERAPLGEQEEFVEEVEEYIPIREERKRKERERREEIERKVKQGGKAVLVVGILAGLVVLGGMSYYYFTRPDPQELPVNKAFVALDYKFLPPPKEFKTVAADEEVMEQIFNPNAAEEDIAKQVQEARGGGGGGGTGGAGGGGGGGTGGGSEGGGSEDENVSEVDMSSSKGSDTVLTDKKINNIILSDFSALRRCIQKELQNNPSFNGVTIKFYIRPNGTTGGVTLQEEQYVDKPVGRCLIREFRQMKFPAHSAVSNKGVTFPLQVQR